MSNSSPLTSQSGASPTPASSSSSSNNHDASPSASTKTQPNSSLHSAQESITPSEAHDEEAQGGKATSETSSDHADDIQGDAEQSSEPDTYTQRSFQSMFPPTTVIKDFGYPIAHPMRSGDFHIPDDSRYEESEDDEDLPEEDSELQDPNDLRSFAHPRYSYAYDNGDIDSEQSTNNTDFYSADEINCKAMALFDFTPENDNEVGLTEGQYIWISYRHGQGWLVAEDPATGENGLVPEEYVMILYDNSIEQVDDDSGIKEDIPKPFLPEILQSYHHQPEHEEKSAKRKNQKSKKQQTNDDEDGDSEWVDTDDEEDANEDYDDINERPTNTNHEDQQQSISRIEEHQNDQLQSKFRDVKLE